LEIWDWFFAWNKHILLAEKKNAQSSANILKKA